MATAGGGPSRRSHTKSRKGCKTCKRRHIRCDETFPQCRNCTKHQVRCDYMESVAEEQQSEPLTVDLQFPEEIESAVDRWQRTGQCSLGSFNIDLHAQGHTYSRNDLRLIYHALWSASHPLTNEFTVWTGKTPKFLAAATSQPFLVHAILAFGSSALAWERNSVEAKKLAYYHGGIALQGLQNALSAFSRENADAVLAASILLSWQANDWRSWSSLVSGIRTVINSMQAWKTESFLADIMLEQERAIPQNFPGFSNQLFSDEDHCARSTSLQSIHDSMEHMQSYLCLRDEETSWVEQLKDYIQQLVVVRPANSPEEQFNHLYTFRKWLFWIPTALLKSDTRDYQTLLILAYYYTTALQLESLYPNVAAAFCSTVVVKPLEEIFRSFLALRGSTVFPNQHTETLLSLLAHPQRIFASYKERRFHLDQSAGRILKIAPPSFERITSDLAHTYDNYHYGLHNSPSFPQPLRRQISEVSSVGIGSPYLEVPPLSWDDSSASSHSGSISHQRHSSSYTLPSMASGYEPEDLYSFDNRASMDYKTFEKGIDKTPNSLDFSGFVQTPPLWA